MWNNLITVDAVQVKSEHITISFLKKTTNYILQQSRGKKWCDNSFKYLSIRFKEM